MQQTVIVVTALALDYWLGEPANAWHPLVAFGKWANFLERRLLNPTHASRRQRLLGCVAWLAAVSPCLIWLAALGLPEQVQIVLSILTLYFCIAARSLQQHAQAVLLALRAGDLPLARARVGLIVSRQTDSMQQPDVRRAAIESVLENGADAVFAPLLWFLILGPFGAVLYRLSNTLDAMWGYKTDRYRYFGWASARLDDLLNWLPARLTAISYALLGDTGEALHAWKHHAPLLDSPNAGPVMCAGAGALNLQLGGLAWYHGQAKDKPWFGGGAEPGDADIDRACALLYRALGLWLAFILAGEYLA